jgi:fervidolysin-like protein
MRARRTALPWLVAAIAIASADGAFAQKLLSPMPNEVVIELSNTIGEQQVDALQRRLQLTRIESQTFQLSNSTFYRWRIPDSRSVASIVRALEGSRLVASAQPNYRFALQENQDVGGPDLGPPKDTCGRSAVLPIVTMINR